MNYSEEIFYGIAMFIALAALAMTMCSEQSKCEQQKCPPPKHSLMVRTLDGYQCVCVQ